MNDKELYNYIEEVSLKKLPHLSEYCELKTRTNYLNEKDSIRNRMWHLLSGKNIPECNSVDCNKTVKWSRKLLDYNVYCSMKCQRTSNEYIEKQKKIFIGKYGVDNPMKVDTFKQKCLDKNNENYSNKEKLKAINEKRKRTSIERYDVENIFCDVEKIKKSNVEKYGVSNINQQHMDMKTCSVENMQYMNSELKMNSVEIGNELGISKSTVCRTLKRNDIDIKRHPTSCG